MRLRRRMATEAALRSPADGVRFYMIKPMALLGLLALLGSCGGPAGGAGPGPGRPPNIVVILMDDMGYADIGAFGAKAYPTPNLDRLAKEGRIFTDFYVSQAVC